MSDLQVGMASVAAVICMRVPLFNFIMLIQTQFQTATQAGESLKRVSLECCSKRVSLQCSVSLHCCAGPLNCIICLSRAQPSLVQEASKHIDVAMASETMCAVCKDALDDGTVIESLPCAHSFHTYCIGSWGQAKGGHYFDEPCPICKTIPREANEMPLGAVAPAPAAAHAHIDIPETPDSVGVP